MSQEAALPLLYSAQAVKGGSKVAETAMCSRAKRVRCALFPESHGSERYSVTPRCCAACTFLMR
jgi:hypothetical protein